jgi:hypothetical protein
MVTISISAAAFDAIKATLAKDRPSDARPDGKGGYLIYPATGGVSDRGGFPGRPFLR